MNKISSHLEIERWRCVCVKDAEQREQEHREQGRNSQGQKLQGPRKEKRKTRNIDITARGTIPLP